MSKLINEDFYFKDSADFKYKNDNNSFFIFRRHVFNGREIIFHLDTVFNREDIDYFLKQIEGIRQQELWEKEFENSRFDDDVKPDSVTRVELNYSNRVKLGYNKYEGITIYTYSIPLFSADKKKAIIIKGFECGLVCGGGGYYIYKKTTDDQWVLFTKINTWAN